MKDFYYILGLPANCSHADIIEAYRKLAQKFKPGTDDQDHYLESHFRDISEAYEILSDPVRRRKYDVLLKKAQQRRLRYFRLKPLNVAATLALIGFTGLFGYYVLHSVNHTKTVKAVQPQLVQVHHQVRHRHRRHHAIIAGAANKAMAIKRDTIPPRTVKPAPVMAGVPAVKPPVKELVAKAPVVKLPEQKPDSSYLTYLKPDLGGSVYLHQRADYMSTVLTILPSHARVRVLEKNRNFCKVAFNDYTGYVPKWTVAER